ncbi:type VI secretion system Vgr family protein [Paraburkholderia phytofirmans]|uniref:type VI secretion system Vgr family protein n=1 Tax=Paraburkholderia sp. BL9I2N2 TaxID=1938809 RepID=UPI00104A7943|nr:type VI secretion system Vgr family protein [Paraburkholderia sp. BL9I2N2]TCK97274.1 type VI secretion system secreted protein VgrG [Paraburkholderia sp. BL9I2N2]
MGAQEIIAAIKGGLLQSERLLKLDTPLGSDVLLPQRVVGHSRIGRNYEFTLDTVSTTDNIELKKLIAQPVTLWIQQTDQSYAPHHGYVHTARRLGSDSAITSYQIGFVSWMHFLRFRKDARIWQDKTVDEILTDVFNMHPQAQGAFRFSLRNPLPQRSFCVQFEDDWNFCQRLMETEGLFGYFEQATDGKSHTLVVTDDISTLQPLSPQTVDFYRSGTNSETDAFVQWSGTRTLQSTSLITRTFDYKAPSPAANPKGTATPTLSTQGDLPQQAEVYEYTGAYSYAKQNRGDQLSKVRMEEWESRAKRFSGVGAVRRVDAGRWFELTNHPDHGAGSAQERQFAVIAVEWVIENNLPVSSGTTDFPHSLKQKIAAARAQHANNPTLVVKATDGSEGFFMATVEAQRKAIPFRSPFEHEKPEMHMQTATVVGPANEEVYTDQLNRIKVQMHWDRLNPGDENASCWIRVAQSDAGGSYGGVHVPRIGEEVIVSFLDGDCDRPIVTGRVYNGAKTPDWHSNGILSGYKSKEYQGSGYNQMVMDDATGQNRMQLYSSSTNAQLHLGYLIAQNGNSRGAYLGSGFDLKSDAYGAVRAAQGLYVTTHPANGTSSQPLDVRDANSQLTNSESVIEALSRASETHQAESLNEGHDALKSFTDATQNSVSGATGSGGNTAGGGTGSANAFKEPIMLFATPAGIAISTQKSAHITATEHVNLVSGQSTHIATGKSLLASVGEKISLFVQNAGMKLFAAKGKVEIQSQSDNVELTAQKTFRLLSATEKIEAAADQEILLTSGGAYIRIAGGNIDIHAPGMVDVKGAQHSFNGPTSQGYPLPSARPDQPGQLELLHQYANGEPVKGGQFSVLDANGGVLRQGALDANGRMTVSGLPPGVAQVQFGADPRDPSQPANYFKSMNWPAEPLNASGDAAAASQMASFLPAAASSTSGAAAAAGSSGVAASAASALASTAKGAVGSAVGGASQLASLANIASQGSGGLTSMAKSQATGYAQNALTKALPSGASAAVSQASQAASTAKEISSIAQSARSALPAINGIV